MGIYERIQEQEADKNGVWHDVEVGWFITTMSRRLREQFGVPYEFRPSRVVLEFMTREEVELAYLKWKVERDA